MPIPTTAEANRARTRFSVRFGATGRAGRALLGGDGAAEAVLVGAHPRPVVVVVVVGVAPLVGAAVLAAARALAGTVAGGGTGGARALGLVVERVEPFGEALEERVLDGARQLALDLALGHGLDALGRQVALPSPARPNADAHDGDHQEHHSPEAHNDRCHSTILKAVPAMAFQVRRRDRAAVNAIFPLRSPARRDWI